MPTDYVAARGDVVLANMNGFEKKDDGSKGSPLPAVASGAGVEV